MDLSLTAQQEQAIDYIIGEVTFNDEVVVALSGPAGSGKTTLTKKLVEELSNVMPVTVCAMTNKAVRVLNSKGIEAMTLHQACMRPIFGPPMDKLGSFLEQSFQKQNSEIPVPKSLLDDFKKEELHKALDAVRKTGICSAFRLLGIKDVMSYVTGWSAAGKQVGALFVDEASMMGGVEFKTALECFDKVVLIGDEHQLPPVKSKPVFWEVPNRVTLTEIHRQAEGSIPLQLATTLRNGGKVAPNPTVNVDIELCRQGNPIIVFANKTRGQLTRAIRNALGYKNSPPQVGEMLICRNTQDKDAKARGLVNNSIWKVIEASGYVLTLEGADGTILENQEVHMEEFLHGNGIEFRYAYALTAHNSQGSEWPTVMVHVPSARDVFAKSKREDDDFARKWLYTALTRAKENVLWVNKVVY